jgi:ATP-dependent protease ClpP protease subunit
VLAQRHGFPVRSITPGEIAARLGCAGFCNRGNPEWLSVMNKGGGVAEITIYEEIGFDPFSGEGITSKAFAAQLKDLGQVGQIRLFINSPGGDVFDGLSIYNQLQRHPARVDVKIDGIAASAASFIAQAGDSIEMAEGSMMMIHDAWGMFVGNSADGQRFVDSLEKVDGEIAGTYSRRSGRSASEFRALMDEETWLSATEAVGLGLADRVAVSREKFAARFDTLNAS